MKKGETQKLLIKNMVCPRCIMVIEDALEKLGLEVQEVQLGEAIVTADPSVSKEKINAEINKYGFELIEGRNQQLIEQIKNELIEYVKGLEETDKTPKLSKHLSKKLNQNYSSLSSVFSENEDITIEKYLIHIKIERVKELLSYGELTLSEIAWKLNYSSVSHLSNQFKNVTGMSVTDYKKARDSFRKSIDRI